MSVASKLKNNPRGWAVILHYFRLIIILVKFASSNKNIHMTIPQYIADAFADRLFSGNQVAVCLPDEDIDDRVMQQIAVENNFSETSFAVKIDDGYSLRWFAPGGELDLCGHATLGTAFVILNEIEKESETVRFHTKSGLLTVMRKGECLVMNFPQSAYRPVEVTEAMELAIGIRPIEAFLGRDLMMVLDRENDVREISPNLELLVNLPGLIQAVTAKGDIYDCASRVFCPKIAIPEDPVTGSTHCMIAPYWSKKLANRKLTAFQASKRSGIIECEILEDNRINIGGRCVLYSKGKIFI